MSTVREEQGSEAASSRRAATPRTDGKQVQASAQAKWAKVLAASSRRRRRHPELADDESRTPSYYRRSVLRSGMATRAVVGRMLAPGRNISPPPRRTDPQIWGGGDSGFRRRARLADPLARIYSPSKSCPRPAASRRDSTTRRTTPAEPRQRPAARERRPHSPAWRAAGDATVTSSAAANALDAGRAHPLSLLRRTVPRARANASLPVVVRRKCSAWCTNCEHAREDVPRAPRRCRSEAVANATAPRRHLAAARTPTAARARPNGTPANACASSPRAAPLRDRRFAKSATRARRRTPSPSSPRAAEALACARIRLRLGSARCSRVVERARVAWSDHHVRDVRGVAGARGGGLETVRWEPNGV